MDECPIFLEKDINNLLSILRVRLKSFYALKCTAPLQFFFTAEKLYFTTGCHTLVQSWGAFCCLLLCFLNKIPVRSSILFLQEMVLLLKALQENHYVMAILDLPIYVILP